MRGTITCKSKKQKESFTCFISHVKGLEGTIRINCAATYLHFIECTRSSKNVGMIRSYGVFCNRSEINTIYYLGFHLYFNALSISLSLEVRGFSYVRQQCFTHFRDYKEKKKQWEHPYHCDILLNAEPLPGVYMFPWSLDLFSILFLVCIDKTTCYLTCFKLMFPWSQKRLRCSFDAH